jgi:carotenoid 1,2-hydratase
VEIDERAAPLPYPVRGQVRLYPLAITERDFVLDGPAGDGRHLWWPIAPRSRIEVEMHAPRLAWRGTGYFDMNAGSEPLERGFRSWDWSRADGDGASLILYDTRGSDGASRALALRADDQGRVEDFTPPPASPLPKTAIWRVQRATRSDVDGPARVSRTLEDTPFYARSMVNSRLRGRPVLGMHESLSLERFASPWVQVLLPFRMPRVSW